MRDADEEGIKCYSKKLCPIMLIGFAFYMDIRQQNLVVVFS